MSGRSKHFFTAFIMSLLLVSCSESTKNDIQDASDELEQSTEEAAEEGGAATKEFAEHAEQEALAVMETMKQAFELAEGEVEENVLQPGDRATAQEHLYVAVTPEAYDQLYQLIEKADSEQVEKLLKENKLIYVSKDEKLEILEREAIRVKVVTESGEEGFAPSTMLDPVK
ncbi:hypothetical protein CVD25_00575 [Bacillus canaveralius]|uniref:Lipoprotein n=1 Tax=Bacillus canaveralius TaxID=1403243 RepID=A0A2N5GFY5_9BACI|nr:MULTISPECIES: hypothetical protein [Bacillus]PLR79652.1 hypothetical protein CU635_21855 [Bacillus canaveralius]PLR80860.1 hypothetical protein CVD23_20255 [Bacillus sp. V33-4]PLS00843.1 hypothetical protein CVD25_00575 [Bacillus canaveralius]RSK53809.1 hypothetical protein EJA13_07385 [Bacillus canaveralius]